jgi:hypothetical protein
MLFKVLNLFGFDVPAKIAAARTEFEHRVEDAADYAKQATTAAVVATFLRRQRFCSSLRGRRGPVRALSSDRRILWRLRWTGCRGRVAHCGGIRTASRGAHQSAVAFRASFC